MNILFLTPQLPYPPRQGAALRNWGLLSELAKQHQVHLLTFAESGAQLPPGLASLTTVSEPQRPLRRRLLELLTTREPDMARRLWSDEFAKQLAALLAKHSFDVVQVEGIELMPYALPYLQHPPSLNPSQLWEGSVPLWLYDAHNAETELQRSAMLADLRQPKRWHAAAYSAIQVWKLRRYEARLLPKFDLVVAVSDTDRRLLKEMAAIEPFLLPNGINSSHFSPNIAQAAPQMQEREGAALVFTGKMDFRPNVDGVLWFVDEILPLIKIQRDGPPPTFWVVGQKPHAALEPLRAHPQVVLTGWVDQIEPYLAGADIVVVPLRMGSGTRLKVLQALSMARPLVGTTLGCSGLALRDASHLRLADDSATFARAISELLQDTTRFEMAERGRRHVQEHFDWKVLVPKLEQAMRARIKRK